MFWIYILKSNKDLRRYVGSTNDLSRRINQHNSGKVLSTKNRRPLVLIYKEEFLIEKEARLREKFLKTHKGYNELKKLI
ncbi:MAG: GIY-YIG nuclease family protein [Candidatus Paceibacterota bacterium]